MFKYKLNVGPGFKWAAWRAATLLNPLLLLREKPLPTSWEWLQGTLLYFEVMDHVSKCCFQTVPPHMYISDLIIYKNQVSDVHVWNECQEPLLQISLENSFKYKDSSFIFVLSDSSYINCGSKSSHCRFGLPAVVRPNSSSAPMCATRSTLSNTHLAFGRWPAWFPLNRYDTLHIWIYTPPTVIQPS